MNTHKSHRLTKILIYLLLLFMITGCSLAGCGKDSAASLRIGPDGGEFDLYGDLSLFVPPDAVDEEIEITLTEISEDDIDQKYLEGLGNSAQLLAAFKVLPDGISFARPLQFQIKNININDDDLPLVYSLDSEGRIMGVAEVRTDLSRQEGQLTIYLGHFSDYATFIKKDYISPECLANPCRCETISIETYDAYNICSEDDCQVTESNVRITFVSCGGNQETLRMKEISPTCQPKLQIVPEKDRILTESSTAVRAELNLSCAPFPDEEIKFSVDQLGKVEPSQTVSDPEGKGEATFTAFEEEGTALVTANASGSYHLLELIVNGQAEYGEERSYQLSKSAEIEIGKIQGHFEGFFDTCRGGWCIQDMQTEIDFVVNEIDWEEGMWYGTMDVSQSGDVICSHPDCNVTGVVIPDYDDLATWGKAYPETQELDLLHMAVFMIEDAEIYVNGEWFSVVGGFMREEMDVSLDTEGIFPFRFKIDGSDTPKQGAAFIFLPNDEMPTMPGTYTLTLEE